MANLSDIEMRIVRAASSLAIRDVPLTPEAIASWTDLPVDIVRPLLAKLHNLGQLP